MKAVVQTEYGPPDVLRIEEVPTPEPSDDEVLVRVKAAALNSWDWDNLRGKPLIARVLAGPVKPRRNVPGADVAGIVEAVGRSVSRFKRGDAVFGDLSANGWGAFAEFVCAHERALVGKPDAVSFADAAAAPQAGVMAYQGIADYGNVRAGQSILVNGAAGGVGTFAVQLAHARRAEVTGVDSGPKLEMLREIGADHVIDYRLEDFARGNRRFDVIVDVVGSRSMFDFLRVMKSTGVYVMVGGSTMHFLQLLVVDPWLRSTGQRRMRILVHEPNKNLNELGEMMASGRLRPVIDRIYSMGEISAAYGRLGRGEVLGKAVIAM